ncbi:LOW QUALITY PROTEIN: cytochrome P450 4p1-like [Bactrocera dorsalis]|uniref:LOW QUALITY PROTEIN: cytochrome P450 4p1-like n=1 Tax=Bactrocera dorsalis TaxID=27457 RepID=A0ABM3JIH0_BACDO|nr:LOW QUALITY PROTEIN: cytochrome P450 4p1-like [Bactrocera dorsalis]
MVFWTLVIGAIIIAWLYKLNKDYVVLTLFTKRVKTVDGTPLENSVALCKGRTIFGNAFDFSVSPDNMFDFSRKLAAEMKRSYVLYGLFTPFYNIITAEDAELVMNDQNNLTTKGIIYNFLEPFLNRGLLTSSGKKWHSRRKMLTPAFHFNILGQFEEIFKEESKKFVESLEAGDLSSVTLNEIIPKFTLNAICETALGVKLDEQMNADQYRASFKMIEEVFLMRIRNPFYILDSVYKVFLAPKVAKHISIVHNFSSEIIDKRRQVFAEEPEHSEDKADDNQSFYTKKRHAMLDTLLRAERDGLIDHVGICEEVDTFMFEGFDTTSMALLFSLMNLSLYPEMQERCYQEILEHVEDDLSQLDIQQLAKLKYLECFIKETLRLYPSVPVIGREVTNETRLANNLILPKGSQIIIHIIDIHRNAKYFENPDKFDPERFTPEASAGRHPFAYVPFSAGQRNCIGQKFAMLELKTVLVNIMKKFKILPLMKDQDIKLQSGMVIRTPNIIKVKLEKRV